MQRRRAESWRDGPLNPSTQPGFCMACKPLLAALTAFSCLNLHVIHWCNQVDDGIKILYKGLFMTLWAYALNTFSKREAANKRKKRGKRVVCVGGLVVARSCVWSKAHARKMAVSRGSTQDVTWHWKCNIVIIHHSKVPAAAAALSCKTQWMVQIQLHQLLSVFSQPVDV